MSPKQARRRAACNQDTKLLREENEREKERKHLPRCALLKCALEQDALSTRTEKP